MSPCYRRFADFQRACARGGGVSIRSFNPPLSTTTEHSPLDSCPAAQRGAWGARRPCSPGNALRGLYGCAAPVHPPPPPEGCPRRGKARRGGAGRPKGWVGCPPGPWHRRGRADRLTEAGRGAPHPRRRRRGTGPGGTGRSLFGGRGRAWRFGRFSRGTRTPALGGRCRRGPMARGASGPSPGGGGGVWEGGGV